MFTQIATEWIRKNFIILKVVVEYLAGTFRDYYQHADNDDFRKLETNWIALFIKRRFSLAN